jgi:hypothetical protein
VYALELLLKLVALGPRTYFKSWWSRFDALMVLTSALDVALSQLGVRAAGVGPAVLRVFRLMRVSRVLRLVKGAKGLRKLLTTLVLSLPSLLNVTSLLFLLLFVYAVLGVQLFWRVAEGEALGDFANFRNFGWALLTLFRCVTGEGWNVLMHDCAISVRAHAPHPR